MQYKKCVMWVALSAMLFSGAMLSGCDNKNASTQRQGKMPEVRVFTVKASPFELTTELSGRTSPYMISEVRPQVNGIILKRNFTEGSLVREGSTLYQIDPAQYQASLNSAKASLEKAQANATVAKATAERYRALLPSNAVSKQEYDQANASYKQAIADVAAAKAAVNTASINLNYTKVNAPISGRIGKSSVTAGALVTANQATPLATVQKLDPMYVDVTQSSTEILKLRRAWESGQLQKTQPDGPTVKLILEDGSEYQHLGTLQFSEVTVDQTTGSVTLRAIFPNPDQELLPGMFVRTVLPTAKKNDAILIPQQAATHNALGSAVTLVVAKDGTVTQREITADKTANGNKWLVTGGLKPGETIIMEGSQSIRFTPGGPAPKVKVAGEWQPAKAQASKKIFAASSATTK